MKKTFGKPIPLHTINRLPEHSTAIKTAAAYKKKITENRAGKRLIQFIAVNVACMILVAASFLLLQDKSPQNEVAPVYYLLEKEQENPGNTKAGSAIATESYGGEEVPLQTQSEIDDAMEIILASGDLGSMGSKEIQPKTQSDFLPILQLRLMDLHYLDYDEPSTYYGAATEAAIKEFQSQHTLPDNGIASFQTLFLLFSDKANSKVIGKGQQGEHIENIQERLNQLGYVTQVNGIFGEQTEQAALAFQLQHGIAQTGRLDQETENLLFSDAAICADGSQFINKAASKQQALNVEAMVDIAYAQLGAKYVPGGKSAGSFDCSGLVYYCLNASGYDFTYMTSNGWRNSNYQWVERMEDLQPGDICTFEGHVGIYVGYGKMIDASSSEGVVRLSSDITQNEYWLRQWQGARRIS